MTDITKRMLIAAAVAVVLIGGSVTALILTGDDEEHDRPLVEAARELDDRIDLEDMVEGFLDRLLEDGSIDGRRGDLFQRFFDGETDGGSLDRLADRLPDLFERFFEPGIGGDGGEGLEDLIERFLDDLRSDLQPVPDDPPQAAPLDPDGPQPRPTPDRAPRSDHILPDGRVEGFGFRLRPYDLPFFGGGFMFPGNVFDGSPLEEFLADGHLSAEEAEELRQWFEGQYGSNGFFFGAPDGRFVVPSEPGLVVPFGDLPLDRLLEGGQISPEEARRLRRMFAERFGFGPFSLPVDPSLTDRPGDFLLDGLEALPLEEFLADGTLSLREQEAIRSAVDAWLERVFSRFGVPAN